MVVFLVAEGDSRSGGESVVLPVEQRSAGRPTTAAIPRRARGSEDIVPHSLTAAEVVTGEIIIAHGVLLVRASGSAGVMVILYKLLDYTQEDSSPSMLSGSLRGWSGSNSLSCWRV